MPIKGLTEYRPALPVLGTFRKGAPKGSNRPGKQLDYFRFTPTNPLDQNLKDEVQNLVGTEPKELTIYLPYDHIEENFVAYMEEFSASTMVRQCTKEVMIRELVGNRMQEVNKPCIKKTTGCECKERGRLYILLDKLARDGVFIIPTGSKLDIRHIHSTLLIHADRAQRFGVRLTDLPLIVRRVEQQVSVPTADGGRKRRAMAMIRLEAHPEYARVMAEYRRRALSNVESAPVLPQGNAEPPAHELNAPRQLEQLPEHLQAPVIVEEPKEGGQAPSLSLPERMTLLKTSFKEFADMTPEYMRKISGLILQREIGSARELSDFECRFIAQTLSNLIAECSDEEFRSAAFGDFQQGVSESTLDFSVGSFSTIFSELYEHAIDEAEQKYSEQAETYNDELAF